DPTTPSGQLHNLRSFTPDDNTIDITNHGFADGSAVTYHAPLAKTFNSLQVDVNPDDLKDGAINVSVTPVNSNNPPHNNDVNGDNIQFVNTIEGDPNEGHPVASGFGN